MKKTLFIVSFLLLWLIVAGPAGAATFTIVNGDAPGEGLNDPTPVAPVGGNTGTTLGEQRMIVLQATAAIWADIVVSSVDVVIHARFDPINVSGPCAVLGQTSQGDPFMNFPGAPVPGVLYHSALADAISGVNQNPGVADFFITYNSNFDTTTCTSPFYYGLDGNAAANEIELFPVVLHEMAHGLGFASFALPSNGVFYFGAPGIFDYYILDMTTGLHWNEMNNGQRAASAINTGNLVWDGPKVTEEVPKTLLAGDMDLDVTSPPAIAGVYDALGAAFGGGPPDEMTAEFELVNTGTATPTDGCDPLIGFTPGKVAFIDRGNCEFGLKSLIAESAGASAAVIANDRDGTVIVTMGGGVDGGSVTIPVVALGQDDGNTIKAELPGVSGILRVNERFGTHASGRALLYAPANVVDGSSVSHWDVTASPPLLMQHQLSPELLDQVDLTPAQFFDVGHAVTSFEGVFADGFESNGTGAWSNTTP